MFKLIIICIYCAILPIDQHFTPIPGITYGKLFGAITILVTLPSILKDHPIPKGIIIPLLLLIAWMIIDTIIIFQDTFQDNFTTLVLNILASIGICHSVYRQKNHINILLISLTISTTILSIFIKKGIGVNESGGRLTIEGLNSNNIGIYASMSICIVVYFLLTSKTKIRWILISLLPLCFYSLANSGSRGGFISLIIGLLSLFTFRNVGFKKKIGFILAGAAIIFLVSSILLSTDVMRDRMGELKEEGDNSRERLWTATWGIYNDNLTTGIGLGDFSSAMRLKSGNAMDPHNVYLYILATTGTIGGILLLIFIFNWARLSYYNGKRNDNTIGLALLLILLFNWSKGGGLFFSKYTWLMFALTIAIALNDKIQVEKRRIKE